MECLPEAGVWSNRPGMSVTLYSVHFNPHPTPPHATINTHENFCKLQEASEPSQEDTSVEVLRKDAAIRNIPWENALLFCFDFVFPFECHVGKEGTLISYQGNVCVNFLSQLYSAVLFFSLLFLLFF